MELDVSQKSFYDTVVAHLDAKRGGVIFCFGPAGTGKTTLINHIATHIKARQYGKPMFVAFTHRAAALLGDRTNPGRTMHTAFHVPLDLRQLSHRLGLQKALVASGNVDTAVVDTPVIFWDEVSMVSVEHFDYVNEYMQLHKACSEPFGGKLVVLTGDYNQLPPVARPLPLQCSRVLSDMKTKPLIFRLTNNFRAQEDAAYCSWLEELPQAQEIHIPCNMQTNTIVTDVFPNRRAFSASANCAILCQTNRHVQEIMSAAVALAESYGIGVRMLPPQSISISWTPIKKCVVSSERDGMVSFIVDDRKRLVLDKQCASEFLREMAAAEKSVPRFKTDEKTKFVVDPSDEFVHYINQQWMCREKQTMSSGSQYCLLYMYEDAPVTVHNIPGMPNNARATFLKFDEGKDICSVAYQGTVHEVKRKKLRARIKTDYHIIDLSFRQFPLSLGIATTVHKSQGAQYTKLGYYVPDQAFQEHGMHYVALSRAKGFKHVTIQLNPLQSTAGLVARTLHNPINIDRHEMANLLSS